MEQKMQPSQLPEILPQMAAQQNTPRILLTCSQNFTRICEDREVLFYNNRPMTLNAWTQTTSEDFEMANDDHFQLAEQRQTIGYLEEKIRDLEKSLQTQTEVISKIHATSALTLPLLTQNMHHPQQQQHIIVPQHQQQFAIQHHQPQHIIVQQHQQFHAQPPIVQNHYPPHQTHYHQEPEVKVPKEYNVGANNAAVINHTVHTSATPVTTESVNYRIVAEPNAEDGCEPIEIQLAEEDGAINLNNSMDAQRLEICLNDDVDSTNDDKKGLTLGMNVEVTTEPTPPTPAQLTPPLSQVSLISNNRNANFYYHGNGLFTPVGGGSSSDSGSAAPYKNVVKKNMNAAPNVTVNNNGRKAKSVTRKTKSTHSVPRKTTKRASTGSDDSGSSKILVNESESTNLNKVSATGFSTCNLVSSSHFNSSGASSSGTSVSPPSISPSSAGSSKSGTSSSRTYTSAPNTPSPSISAAAGVRRVFNETANVTIQRIINQPANNHNNSISHPITNQLTTNQPIVRQPIVNQPTINQSIINHPTVNQHTINHPSSYQPNVSILSVNRPAVNRSMVNQPLINRIPNRQPVLNRSNNNNNNNRIRSAVDEDLTNLNENCELVVIGPNKTTVPASVFRNMTWKTCSSSTRELLMTLFDRDTLATHSMTGKPSPAFKGQNKPLKSMLNPSIVQDIVYIVARKCNVSEKEVRTCITTKCADENKMMKQAQEKAKLLQREHNKENIPKQEVVSKNE